MRKNYYRRKKNCTWKDEKSERRIEKGNEQELRKKEKRQNKGVKQKNNRKRQKTVQERKGREK